MGKFHTLFWAGAFAALALSWSAAAGQSDEPAVAPSIYEDLEIAPALWRIEDEDSVVWLFGTFHLLPSDLEWRNAAINQAFEGADAVYFEADVNSPEVQAELAALMPQLGFNEAGVTLSSLLSETANARLGEIAPRLGLAPAAMEGMQPWLAALTLSVLQIQALGFEPQSGVEMILEPEARAAGKTLGYFETAEEQLRLFAELPMEVQIAFLEQSLDEIEMMDDMLDQMLTTWATGDVETFYAIVVSPLREQAPNLFDAIFVERNENWIPQIVEILAGDGTAFIAVGAGHMPGEDGVIDLLEAEGLEVERIQ